MTEEDHELMSRDQTAMTESAETIRKIYVKPRLTLYGDVKQITQGSGGGNFDGNQTGNSFSGSA